MEDINGLIAKNASTEPQGELECGCITYVSALKLCPDHRAETDATVRKSLEENPELAAIHRMIGSRYA